MRSNDPIFPGVASATCMQCECPERAPIPCDTSDLHAPCCAAQQLACVPGPKPRRETRDANAEEATGEKQLLRLERPFQTAGPTYNVIQNARGFLTKQVMRCRARLTAPLGRAQPPLSTTPYPLVPRMNIPVDPLMRTTGGRIRGKIHTYAIVY